MLNRLTLSDFVNDAVRILIIAVAIEDKKSIKLTEYRVKLCDYYLKFPCTMFGNQIQDDTFKANFDEYYSFFHWQPNMTEYRQSLNFLISKGLLEKVIDANHVVYKVTERGVQALAAIDNDYKKNLVKLSVQMVIEIYRLSTESAIEREIRQKSDILSKRLRETQ
jgi:DNA-binding PadR family transcriptional regulator